MYADEWCKPCTSCTTTKHQNEIRTIVATSMDTTNGEYILQVDTPITNIHYAGAEYQVTPWHIYL